MLSFVYPSLLWGLTIVTVPVLIHLINMMRHRRVRWAAMDFLLASEKKNRVWILLRQLLLLLLRMGIVAAVVAAIAQPLWRGDLAGLLGHSKTHHIVLLDDSFSMSACRDDVSAIGRAKAVVQAIAEAAAAKSESQTFTLLRFSLCNQNSENPRPDFLEEPIDTQFNKRASQLLTSIDASQTSVGPLRALEALTPLLDKSHEERRVIYLLSDFRRRNWDESAPLVAGLKELSDQGIKLRFIDCADAVRSNLAVSSLKPIAGTHAAGVPMFMEVTIENYGNEPVTDVSVTLEEDGHSRPAMQISHIPPRTTVSQRFNTCFTQPGEHRVVARLDHDVVADDNSRWTIVDIAAEVPVLIIDGDSNSLDGWFLAAALSPGGPVRTGIAPQIASPQRLSSGSLDKYDAVYLTDPGQLQPAVIEALENYVNAGGGLAVFLGPHTNSLTVNEEFYRQGKGFFPLPLAGVRELQPDRLAQQPDLMVTDHRLFNIFQGRRNNFLTMVNVWRYFHAAGDWKPPADSGTQVIARTRNGAPLVVESRFGKGHVVVFLTTAAPTWNNWAKNNPSFVVIVQELQSLIARSASCGQTRDIKNRNGSSHKTITRKQLNSESEVGEPLRIEFSANDYLPTVRFILPTDENGKKTEAPLANPFSAGVMLAAAPVEDGLLRASLPDTSCSGVYEVQLTKTDVGHDSRCFAVNVNANEGDLQKITTGELATRLHGIDYEFLRAADSQLQSQEIAGHNFGDLLLVLAALLLITEQMLAYWASYHPPLRRETGKHSVFDHLGTTSANGCGGMP